MQFGFELIFDEIGVEYPRFALTAGEKHLNFVFELGEGTLDLLQTVLIAVLYLLPDLFLLAVHLVLILAHIGDILIQKGSGFLLVGVLDHAAVVLVDDHGPVGLVDHHRTLQLLLALPASFRHVHDGFGLVG